MSNIIQQLETEQMRDDVPEFGAGDTVEVNFLVTYEPEPPAGMAAANTVNLLNRSARRERGWPEP